MENGQDDLGRMNGALRKSFDPFTLSGLNCVKIQFVSLRAQRSNLAFCHLLRNQDCQVDSLLAMTIVTQHRT